MRAETKAYALLIATMALIVASLAVVIISQPAEAREIEPEWTWRIYPSDRTNTGAYIRMKLDSIEQRVGEIIEQYEAEQAALEAEQAAWEEQQYYESYAYAPSYSGYSNDFKSAGVVYDGETRYTWYSQHVLPGGGLDALNSNGRTVNADGYVVDGDGYIAVASCDYAMGEVISTPFGEAKVYDYCPTSGTVDVYTDF